MEKLSNFTDIASYSGIRVFPMRNLAYQVEVPLKITNYINCDKNTPNALNFMPESMKSNINIQQK